MAGAYVITYRLYGQSARSSAPYRLQQLALARWIPGVFFNAGFRGDRLGDLGQGVVIHAGIGERPCVGFAGTAARQRSPLPASRSSSAPIAAPKLLAISSRARYSFMPHEVRQHHRVRLGVRGAAHPHDRLADGVVHGVAASRSRNRPSAHPAPALLSGSSLLSPDEISSAARRADVSATGLESGV